MATQEVMIQFRTDDLALAAFLSLNDIEHHKLEVLGGGRGRRRVNAVWVYNQCAELPGLVADYEDGCAEVEPRDFMDAVAKVRAALYSFLDSQDT